MINIVNWLKVLIERRIEPYAVKGYFDIQDTNPDLVNEIKDNLANHQISLKRTIIENIIFPKNINIQLAFHQYLFSTLLGTMFNRVVLFSIHRKKKIIYPLPSAWLRILQKSGLPVSIYLSSCFFYLFIAVSFFAGVAKLFSHIILNIKRIKVNQKHVYFLNLHKECFPPNRDQNSYDIMSWYTKKYNLNNPDNSRLIVHSVPNINNTSLEGHKIFYAQDCFPKMSLLSFYFKFLPAVIFTSLVVILSFRLRNIILLREIIDMYAFKFADKSCVANKYFFNYTNLLYRPLWTYIAESKGSSLIWYFYSCHIANYEEPNKRSFTATDFFQILNWPKYLVWNENHAEYIRQRIDYPSEIEVVGPIGYSDNSVALPRVGELSVLVFDIQPLKLTYSIPASCGQWYKYDYKVRTDFFNDIESICTELGVNVFFKRKRNNPRIHKGYLDFIHSFVKNEYVHEIDTGVSAFRLCKQFNVVLSMPFTASSVVADFYGKDAAYYDPTGIIQKNDKAAHNLQVINGKAELRDYLNKIFKFGVI